MLGFMLSLLSAVKQFSLWQKFAMVPWKLVGLGAAAVILIFLTLKVLSWKHDAEKLDQVLAENARVNALNQQSQTIGLDTDEGLNAYKTKVRTIKVPVGATFDADGVRRIEQRIEAGRAAKRAEAVQ